MYIIWNFPCQRKQLNEIVVIKFVSKQERTSMSTFSSHSTWLAFSSCEVLPGLVLFMVHSKDGREDLRAQRTLCILPPPPFCAE